MDGTAFRIDRDYRLDDRYARTSGRVYLTGTQALVRLLLAQSRFDSWNGLSTAGFVSGYRGSPLGGVDQALWQARLHLDAANVRFQPAINEDLAATAVLGTQQVESEGGATVDGVFALWYGKGPGVDRAGDALKHGNALGSSPRGGVLVVAGDDHGVVSSSMPHQSDQAFMAWSMPIVNPASIAEYQEFGLYGWALSRFSGAWVGFKAISETVESAASVELADGFPTFSEPADYTPPPGGLHYRLDDLPGPALEERLAAKLDAVRAFARVNSIDRMVVPAPEATLGIVTAGKAHLDLMEALRLMGLDEAELARLGVRIYKLGLTFPVEPVRLRAFAKGLREIVVVEEKGPVVEMQLKDLFYGLHEGERPMVLGKKDIGGASFLPATGELRPSRVAPVLARWLARVRPGFDAERRLEAVGRAGRAVPLANPTRRTPYFCSGCPHNTSTKLPEGSRAGGGIGCHFMASWMDRQTGGMIQMGGEGVNWVGLAPFTKTGHVFQNLGDGTYFHSGYLAVRQAVAAQVDITYKILFNDAVAMTGGQPVDGTLTVPRIARQVAAEGVRRIAVVSDEPDKYPADAEFPSGVTFHHRDELDLVQRELRETKGVTVLIYDQTCAAEKRRRRKRGEYPDPAKRVLINDLVCEGCGDCTKKSNCLSVVPVETEFGRKRAIDQSSCNKDYACVEGFCPSFVSVEGGALRKPSAAEIAPEAFRAKIDSLPPPAARHLDKPYEILVTGVGGTGVVTIGALMTMAAHLEGKGGSVLDFMGFAQKGGAVLSYVRLDDKPADLNQVRIDIEQADLLLTCDLVVGTGVDALGTVRKGRTRAVANEHPIPTAASLRDPKATLDVDDLKGRLVRAVGRGKAEFVDAHDLALRLTGDSIGANMLLMGFAWQKGLIPLSLEAIERAIELNGVAVEANKAVFAWGRIAAHDPAFVRETIAPRVERDALRLSATLDETIERRARFLADYQDDAYAGRYRAAVRRVEAAERALVRDGTLRLTEAVARNLFKLMAYKDEYEVARLYTNGEFLAQVRKTFEGDYSLRFHLAPPLLARKRKGGDEPAKMTFGPWMLTAFRLLARLKGVRGTPFDPFGWTGERRTERRLVADYLATLDELLAGLDRDRLGTAAEIASLPDDIRGFGPVKAANLAKAEERKAQLLDAFRHHEPPLAVAAQ